VDVMVLDVSTRAGVLVVVNFCPTKKISIFSCITIHNEATFIIFTSTSGLHVKILKHIQLLIIIKIIRWCIAIDLDGSVHHKNRRCHVAWYSEKDKG
jgi:hypothetical protein